MRTGDARSIGLGPFLRVLQARLQALQPEAIRAALLFHAERLSAREREAFLAIFPEATSGRSPGEAPALGSEPSGDLLLADIDRFVEAIRRGAYYDGWGWDDDIHEERAYGDESWVEEMDDLLAAAGGAFLDGDLALAREAYRRLLHAFLLEEDGATFSGPRPADEMVETDLSEAKARYLRTLYQTTAPGDRPERLVGELTALRHVGDRIRLQALVDASPEPLSDLEAFLPAWINRLRSELAAAGPFASEARALLSEAVELHGGPEGLRDLARSLGTDHPELFEDWIGALIRAGRRQEAIGSAQEALAMPPSHGAARACLCETIARVAAEGGDQELALEARRQAWRAAPSRDRLLELVAAARVVGRQEDVIANEADLVEASLGAGKDKRSFAGSVRQACEVLLLAGRVQPALKAAKRADPLGWSGAGHAGPVLVPFLMVAGSVGAVPEQSLLLSDVFDSINTAGWMDRHAPLDSQYTIDVPLDDGEDDVAGDPLAAHPSHPQDPGPAPAEPLLLSSLLGERLAREPFSEAERRRWLAEAKKLVEKRTAAVVEGKHRRAYDRVALLVAACGEALEMAEGRGRGTAFAAEVRARYPRHTAFRSELDRATRGSPLMPDPPRGKGRRFGW